MKISKIIFALPLVVGLSASAFAADKAASTSVTWDKVPAAVQKTITDNAKGQTFKKVREMTVDGKEVYKVKITNADKTTSYLQVDADGNVVADAAKTDAAAPAATTDKAPAADTTK